MFDFLKKLFFIFLISFLEINILMGLLKYYVFIPITFLTFSYYSYKSKKQIGPLLAFFIGIFVDLISGTYLGLNALCYLVVTYYINSYVNVFKLFSYLQICLFFGLSSGMYVAVNQIVTNLSNFSYLLLLTSTLVNIILCLMLAVIGVYFPNIFRIKK